MYARVSTFEGPPEQTAEGIRVARRQFLPAAQLQEGFRGMYLRDLAMKALHISVPPLVEKHKSKPDLSKINPQIPHHNSARKYAPGANNYSVRVISQHKVKQPEYLTSQSFICGLYLDSFREHLCSPPTP